MENDNPPSKRRRLDNGYINSPLDSSSDELAASSDHEIERLRASWSARKAYASRRYHRSHDLSDSGSPDELAVDADTYWGRNTRQHSRGHGHSRSPSQGTAASSSSKLEDTPQRSYNEDEELRAPSVERTPSPPPQPPPKPEWVTYKEKFMLKGHLRGVSAVQFSPDGSMIASGGADGAVKVWDTGTGKLIHTFEGHLAGISTVAWSPDGETIASGSDDKSIRLWNVLTGKAHPIPFVGHHNYVYALAFSPKGNMIVSGSYDEAVFLWDVRSARVMRSLPAHSDPVAGVDVVRDGTLIVSCSTDGLIRVWDTATGQCLRTLVHDDNPPVTAVRFSPNGKFVLAWTLDNCVRLWNYVEGKCIKTYQGHVNRKYSLSGGFGVYGQPELKPEAFAVSGSEDGSLLCWDVVSKKVLQKIEGHTNAVLGVDTGSYDGKRYLVSCSLDRTVRVWEEIEVSDSQLNGIEEESTELGNPSPLPAQAQERATDGDRTPGDVMIE